MEVLTSLAGLLLGLLLGWFLWRRGKPGAAEYADDLSRFEVTKRRLREAEADRKFAVDRASELQRVLKCEHQLLDSVADRSGVAPRDFRRSIARDYLHAEDPCREMFLGDPVEIEARFNVLTGPGASRPSTSTLSSIAVPALKPSPSAQSPSAQSPSAQAASPMLAQKDAALAEKERELGEVRVVIEELRTKVEDLVASGNQPGSSDQSSPVIDLREDRRADAQHVAALEAELNQAYWALDQVADAPGRAAALNQEVASLRARLADQSIKRSDFDRTMANEAARRKQLESYLVVLLEDLDQARAKIDDSQIEWPR